MNQFQGVKVFSATKARDREMLGEVITDWLRTNSDKDVVDKIITQSSDSEFHCLTITLFYTFATQPRKPMCEVDWCEERRGHDGPHTGETPKAPPKRLKFNDPPDRSHRTYGREE